MKNKRDAIETIEVGDRINWSDGRDVWGTVTEIVERCVRHGADGPVFPGITLRIHCTRYPAFDASGWPTTTDCTVTRTFRFATDLYAAYTPGA